VPPKRKKSGTVFLRWDRSIRGDEGYQKKGSVRKAGPKKYAGENVDSEEEKGGAQPQGRKKKSSRRRDPCETKAGPSSQGGKGDGIGQTRKGAAREYAVLEKRGGVTATTGIKRVQRSRYCAKGKKTE